MSLMINLQETTPLATVASLTMNRLPRQRASGTPRTTPRSPFLQILLRNSSREPELPCSPLTGQLTRIRTTKGEVVVRIRSPGRFFSFLLLHATGALRLHFRHGFPQSSSRQRPGGLTSLEHNLTVHEHRAYALAVLERLQVRGAIDHNRGVEQRDVGEAARAVSSHDRRARPWPLDSDVIFRTASSSRSKPRSRT